VQLDILEPLGDGGFGDVYKARDELERIVAVKIIRDASEGVADALAHARALARAAHPNVVAVHTIDRVKDPSTKEEKDCVVMELLEGVTLESYTTNKQLEKVELKVLGGEIIDGLRHIHSQGMTHGDLHAENIMICNGHAKIIDILYLNTLALLGSGPKKVRVKRDFISLRLILQQLFINSDLPSSAATSFNNELNSDSGIDEIKNAFVSITDVDEEEQVSLSINSIYAKLIDPDFVETEQYVEALLEEVPDGAAADLLYLLADEGTFEYKHQYFVEGLWQKISKPDRQRFLVKLSTILDEQIPKGHWWPPLRILRAIGASNWTELTKIVRLRIESLIIKDILAGYKDIYGSRLQKGGSLGTYSITYWKYFSDKKSLAANLISMLHQSWYTQNYVASHFMYMIPKLAIVTDMRQEFIDAFSVAINNDAKTVINNLTKLPQEWQDEIMES